MSSQPYPVPPSGGIPAQLAPSTSQSSLWERISTWASENKAIVYTIAGVVVAVTGAGVVYYLTDSVSPLKSLPWFVLLMLCLESKDYRTR